MWAVERKKYFSVFGSKYYLLRDRENLAKFDQKIDEGIFLSYSKNSRAYRNYNLRTQTIIESINMLVNDTSREAPSKGEQVDAPGETRDEEVGDLDENSKTSLVN